MIKKIAMVLLCTGITMIGFVIGWMIGEAIYQNEVKNKCESISFNVAMQRKECKIYFGDGAKNE